MKYSINTILRLASAIAVCMMSAFSAGAFDKTLYADNSVLSDGHWVKISVAESGVYKITKAQLSQWGFKNPAAVRIYGYGGKRIDDVLNEKNYIDDLPLVQSVATDDGGVVFYAQGPGRWAVSSSYHRYDKNIYTNAGYYFVTERPDVEPLPIQKQGTGNVDRTVDFYIDRLHYEQDLTSPGEAGYVLVGENFKNNNNRKFTFKTPGWVKDTELWMECTIVAKTYESTQVDFVVNGNKLATNASDKIAAIANSGYLHGDYTVSSHKFLHGGNEVEVKISIKDINITQGVWLDYIALNYQRKLELPASGHLNFWSEDPALALSGADEWVTVWDVTNPLNITALNTTAANGQLKWGNDYTGMRDYVAWSAAAALPSPTLVGTLHNQNIHSLPPTQMVIFTLPEFKAQAEKVAEMHRTSLNPLHVTVLNVDEVYNEFASGAADVSALRKCLKMFYDRSDSLKLGYALIMGRATYDNRHLTAQFNSVGAYNTVPYYIGGVVKSQFSDNTAFGTDDFIAMLEDGSGANLGLDDLSVAVGRIPVTSVAQAKNIVEKLYQYNKESMAGNWKNSFLFLADDGDNGIHMEQTENMIANLIETPDHQNFITKVYVDAYDIVGGICQDGRNEMYRMLDDGVVWWNFCGHANNHSWTGEGMLTFTDINNMYLKKVPVLMAATCDFLRWDSQTMSGGEIMFHERNGGVISAISATRPVYISDNGLFTKAIGRAISKRDEQGRLPRLGDIYRNAKNNILNERGEKRSNPNRLRYVLMGDPAMMMPTPSNIVCVDSIGGQPLTPDAQLTLMALEQSEIKGSVRTPQGQLIEDFNGTVYVNLYDAELSLTTKGDRAENVKVTFEQHGEKLYAGIARVVDGRFTIKVAMPGEIADNFRPAMLNMYACTDDKTVEAVGVNSDFFVYGYDETVEADTEAPVIKSLVLNHETFVDGDVVNESPMVIAEISDNVGINLSAAGIGHQMVIQLDGRYSYNDVSLYYTPSAEGSNAGVIRYPLKDLTKGDHQLVLKVWDTASNSAQQQLTFKVDELVKPKIFDVYTDVNPASTEVKFYVNHNRPDAELTVTLTVYDLLGHPLWETTSKGVSNMFVSSPITWDLTDASGRRLPRGIYLYRATISTNDGDTYDSAARRLAITAY